MSAPTWLGPVRQSAFLTDDIEATATEWAETHGVGPWFLYDVDIPDSNYRGRQLPMRGRMGLAQSGVQQIELIQPDLTDDSIYAEFLSGGGTGLHHVCFWADLERAEEHFVGLGSEVVQSGTTSAGNGYLYVTGSVGVPYIEIVDPKGQMADFFALIAAAAANWDGTNPLQR